MEKNDAEEEEEEFGFSRTYFLAKEIGGPGKKATRKVSDINVVDEKELRAAYSNLETKHESEIASLLSNYRSSYPKWLFDLRCGFNLLMYGFGSKKALIEDFASTAFPQSSVLVVNGYLQSVNIKQVVIALAELLWDEVKSKKKAYSGNMSKLRPPFSSKSVEDIADFLNGSSPEVNDTFVCVVVHNIDGPALREPDTQQCLAKVAACSRVRMIASVDHVNAPLLWDKKMVHTQFNWLWLHVPTFAPYKAEALFYPLILAQGGTGQSTKTAIVVLQSLTSNAQSVFRVLAEHQIAHPDDDGMAFTDLYSACREKFLVSSQVTLNSHLTEFKDHELVKKRKNSDGQDCLYIPLPVEAIEKLVQMMNQ